MLWFRAVSHLLSKLPIRLPSLALGPASFALSHRQWGAVGAVAAVAGGLAWWALARRKVDPEEMERLRRSFLAEQGRITDAMLIDSAALESNGESLGEVLPRPAMAAHDSAVDTHPDETAVRERLPSVLRYQYRIAGVTYESAQDVSVLSDRVRHLRMDLPVQVRYDPHNPTNSIVVAEAWTGLRQG